MNNVEFETDNDFKSFRKERKLPSMVRFLLKLKLAKDEKQANTILLTIAGIFILITIYNFANYFGFSLTPHKQIQQTGPYPWEVNATKPVTK